LILAISPYEPVLDSFTGPERLGAGRRGAASPDDPAASFDPLAPYVRAGPTVAADRRITDLIHQGANMLLKNICRGFAVAFLAASFAGCGGGDVTTNVPTSPQRLSPEMQEFKTQVMKNQKDRVAHNAGSVMNRFGKARHR
jgi:hypothetical protein